MVRSISTAVSNRIAKHLQPAESRPQAPGTDSGYYWHMMPDVSDEVARKITKASAWMAWGAINRQIHQQKRAGRTVTIKANAHAGRIGVGLRQLARSVGADPSTVRRQCRRLEQIGLIVMHKPETLSVSDPATGRITTKSLGRCKATMIYLTVTEAHGRPSRDGCNLPPSPPSCKVQSATTSREEKNIYPLCGDAVGIGSPTAEGESGLTAAEAGRHSPAEAFQEEPVVIAINTAAAGLEVTEPTLPPCLPRRSKAAGGRRTGQPAKSRPAGSTGHTGRPGAFPEDHAEPRPFTGTDAERFAAMWARLEAEKAERETNNPPTPRPPSSRQIRQEAACHELREAASKLTTEQTERASDYRPSPEIESILAVVNRKRAEMGVL